jgi:hypothetical protein
MVVGVAGRRNGSAGQTAFTKMNAVAGQLSPKTSSSATIAAMRRGRLGLGLILACAVLPGCGGSDGGGPKRQQTTAVQAPQRAILTTIDSLQTATRAGDGRRICRDLFTQKLARSIEKSSKSSCATRVLRTLFKRGESISVQREIRVEGETASATIRDQNANVSTMQFVEQGGRWRIDRVTPQKAG